MVIFFVFMANLAAAVAIDCTNKTDGTYERTCHSYTTCANGRPHHVDCSAGTVFNPKTLKCEDSKLVAPPCGIGVDCSNKADGSYGDVSTHCRTYYACKNGLFVGRTYCPPRTVFSGNKQKCDWKANVLPPCGTKT